MLIIEGKLTREAKFLKKNTNDQLFKKENYLFCNLKHTKKNALKKIFRLAQNHHQCVLFANNFKNEFKIEKMINLILKKKLNIKLILIPKINKKFEKIKVVKFIDGKKYMRSFLILNPYKKTYLQRVFNFRNIHPYESNFTPYGPNDFEEYCDTPAILVKDDILYNLIHFLFKNKNYSSLRIKFLNFYYILKFFPQLRILNQIIYNPISFLKRLKSFCYRILSVWSMFFFLFLFPKIIYKFSTRNVFPSNKYKFKFSQKLFKNAILIDKKHSSNKKKFKEANVVLRGDSLNNYKIHNKKIPTFILSCVNPNEIELMKKKIDKSIIKKSIFVYPSLDYLKEFINLNYLKKMKLGNSKEKFKTLMIDCLETRKYSKIDEKTMLKNKNFCKKNKIIYLRAFKNFFPRKPLNSEYFPNGSGLVGIFAIKSFVNKINIYGWDFHLKSNPKKFYSSFIFLLNNLNYDLELRGHNHFEGLLINLYFAAKFSEDKDIKIFSYLNNLNKHSKLINNIEKVLYN